jgi:hypothetical protein
MFGFILGFICGACAMYIWRNGWNVFRVRISELFRLSAWRDRLTSWSARAKEEVVEATGLETEK